MWVGVERRPAVLERALSSEVDVMFPVDDAGWSDCEVT